MAGELCYGAQYWGSARELRTFALYGPAASDQRAERANLAGQPFHIETNYQAAGYCRNLESMSGGNVELGVILSRAQRARRSRAQHDSLAGIGPALEIPGPLDLEATMGDADAAASGRYWIKSTSRS